MGAWDGYYSLGGVELTNLERFLTYASTIGSNVPIVEGGLDELAGLSTVVGDNPYSTPVDDRAPWVDLDDPVTHDFLGMRILSVAGIDDSKTEAGVTESLAKGGTVGEPRAGSREMRFTALLAGLTPEAVQAGLTWLERVFWARKIGDRQIVPQMQGRSDLRFFEQRPDPIQQIVNRVSNPEATGLGESLVGTAGTAYAFRALVAEDWAYKIIARSDAAAEAQLLPVERALAIPGQSWMGRALLWRDPAVLGPRTLRLFLRFRDQYGNIIEAVGKDDTSVPEGVLYRWTDGRYDSTSQRLTPEGMLTNWVVNPSAEGKLLGLGRFGANAARAALISFRGFQGKRAYQITAGTTGTATVSTPPVPATAGQQWWGRGRARLTDAWGARHLRADLRFLDAADRQLALVRGKQIDLVPRGTIHKWVGARFRSASQQITGDVRRTNYIRNPIPRKDLYGYASGGGATVALERFTGLGTPYAIRVSVDDNDQPQAGVNLENFTVPADGTVLYLTFWAIGMPNLVLTGHGFTDAATGKVNPSVGMPITIGSATPTRVSLAIKVTSGKALLLRIARRAGAGNGYWRMTRVGLLTGSDRYFDGDTGTFEAENPTDPYTSSIAHLEGDYDLYNTVRDSGFDTGTAIWNAGTNAAIAWARTAKRLSVRATGPVASGSVFARTDVWPYIAGGQRVSGAMKVFNVSTVSVTVAVRITSSTGKSFEGSPVTIPAGGSAWLTVAHSGMPSNTAGAWIGVVARSGIASGTEIHVDNVWMGTVPNGSTITEDRWFNDKTPSTNGPRYDSASFDFSVGGVAPEGTEHVELLLTRLSQGATLSTDRFVADQLMLAQYDAQQALVTYDWVGAANASQSTESLNGRVVRTNLLTNPSFEVGGTTGWAPNGAATISDSTDVAHSGTKSALVSGTADAAGTYVGMGLALTGLTPGETYTFSTWVYVPESNGLLAPAVVAIGAAYAAGTSFASSPRNQWVRGSVTFVAGSSGEATVVIYDATSAAGANAGRSLYVDDTMLELGATAGDYFDGSTVPADDAENEFEAVMPAYFDGDFPSTYQTVPSAAAVTGEPGEADTQAYELTVTAEAPVGAVTAEIAVRRDIDSAAASDVFYADELMLAQYDPMEEVPAYTPITRQQVISEFERHFQDTFVTAGPTVLNSWTLGPEGCNGAAATVEFTVVAENPTRLRDEGTTIELPLPSTVDQDSEGLGAFAKLEDRTGIVKNYMPQFPPYSAQIPESWVTTAAAGSVTAAAVKPNSVYPYILRVVQGTTTSIGKTVISARNVLGPNGGYESATASVWVGGSVVGSTITVTATTFDGSTQVGSVSKTFTVPNTTSLIFDDAHRVDLELPSTGGAADGFEITVTTSTGFGTAYIGNPQVTLGSTPFPQINAALPDDGTFTFGTDGVGYAQRVPVAQIESHTIFPNKTAPPVALASLGGYDEVGLTTFRSFAPIPADVIPRNAAAVPIVRVDFDRFISRWVRFRFYPNPQNLSAEEIPTSSYEYEWVIDQFNGNVDRFGQAGYMSIVVDGVSERVWLRAWDGTVLPGDQYVVTADGGPIGWPAFRDIPWVVSVDYPTFKQSTSAPNGEDWWRASLALMIEE